MACPHAFWLAAVAVLSRIIADSPTVFIGSSRKRGFICSNCKKKGHSIENFWSKGGGKEGQGPRQKMKKKPKKKKGKEKENTAEATSDDDKDLIAISNSECAALIKDGTGATIILDTGTSSHMSSHKELLKNFLSFSSPRKIRAADKETFDAL